MAETPYWSRMLIPLQYSSHVHNGYSQRTEEDVRTSSVRKHLVVVIRHISESNDVQLRLATATSCIDG